jgi:uncharacterized Zn-finger protein
MKPAETIEVDETSIACDGGTLGHPRVFLELGDKGEVDCPYCGRRFVLKSRAAEAASP